MSLDRAIASGQERRAPYRRSSRFDPSCRHGGSCPYCRRNRLIGTRRRTQAAEELAGETTQAVHDLPAQVAAETQPGETKFTTGIREFVRKRLMSPRAGDQQEAR